MSCFIYADLISTLLDPKLADPRSTLIHVGTYDSHRSKMIVPAIFYPS